MNPITLLTGTGALDGPKKNVLDIGCSDGRFGLALRDLGHDVTFADKEVQDLPNFIQCDVETFDSTEKFDLIIARHVLPFTNDPVATYNKLFNHLKDGGHILATFFGKEDEWQHLSLISDDDFSSLLGHRVYTAVEKGIGTSKSGKRKQIHVYSMVAKR